MQKVRDMQLIGIYQSRQSKSHEPLQKESREHGEGDFLATLVDDYLASVTSLCSWPSGPRLMSSGAWPGSVKDTYIAINWSSKAPKKRTVVG